MSKSSFCPVCRATLPSGTTVCGECGASSNITGVLPSQRATVDAAVAHYKNPSLAAVLSFLIPGFGQWYLRRWKNGAAWFIGSILLVFLLDGLMGTLSYFLSFDATGPAVVAIIAGAFGIRIASARNAKKIADQM